MKTEHMLLAERNPSVIIQNILLTVEYSAQNTSPIVSSRFLISSSGLFEHWLERTKTKF